MILLIIEPDDTEASIDQILMVVPDNFDRQDALTEATTLLGPCGIIYQTTVSDCHEFSLYRPYTG